MYPMRTYYYFLFILQTTLILSAAQESFYQRTETSSTSSCESNSYNGTNCRSTSSSRVVYSNNPSPPRSPDTSPVRNSSKEVPLSDVQTRNGSLPVESPSIAPVGDVQTGKGSPLIQSNGTAPVVNVQNGNGMAPTQAPGYHSDIGIGSRKKRLSVLQKIVTALSISIAFSGALSLAIIFFLRRQHSRRILNQKTDQNLENYLANHEFRAPKRYNYSEIKKMTNSFSEKLGQGGYGSVFKGTLTNGDFVAVKLLSQTRGNGEEFINEVVSISKTSHVNVVQLLGFCYERNKRALVYEFMPKKSLDNFINNNTNCQLGWDTLFKIAVGVAKGLEYLHRGCNTSIVHFDIKPQNILLDEDFCPKISDFGLAKLSKKKQSFFTTNVARGTIGFIAPEVYCKQFGRVSSKSDVYSYGMLVLAIAGARNNDGIGTLESGENEKNFTDQIYEHIVPHGTGNLDYFASEEEEEIMRKMILVGVWCIQTISSHRPTMSEVVVMLEGSLQAVQIPPKPCLFSPMPLNEVISDQELFDTANSKLN